MGWEALGTAAPSGYLSDVLAAFAHIKCQTGAAALEISVSSAIGGVDAETPI